MKIISRLFHRMILADEKIREKCDYWSKVSARERCRSIGFRGFTMVSLSANSDTTHRANEVVSVSRNKSRSDTQKSVIQFPAPTYVADTAGKIVRMCVCPIGIRNAEVFVPELMSMLILRPIVQRGIVQMSPAFWDACDACPIWKYFDRRR